ncbi:MAG TPA: hypothetical protein VI981_01805 [Candidatus Paceibacterota bacterium]
MKTQSKEGTPTGIRLARIKSDMTVDFGEGAISVNHRTVEKYQDCEVGTLLYRELRQVEGCERMLPEIRPVPASVLPRVLREFSAKGGNGWYSPDLESYEFVDR